MEDFGDDATLYVEGEPSEWNPASHATVGVEDIEAKVEALPPEAEGKRYFLEVSIAREILVDWERNLGRDVTLDEKVERVIYYARFDA